MLNACRIINNLLLSGGGDGEGGGGGSNVHQKKDGVGADDFTPLLIYATIRSATPQLGSNLSYIERYRMASKLSGEAAYYFVQLVSDDRAAVVAFFLRWCACAAPSTHLRFFGPHPHRPTDPPPNNSAARRRLSR